MIYLSGCTVEFGAAFILWNVWHYFMNIWENYYIENDKKEKKEIDILSIKINNPEQSRKVKNISLAFVENQNITEKVISIVNGTEIEKWFFVKVLIEAITQNLQNEKSSEIDEIIEYNLRTLHKIILEKSNIIQSPLKLCC